MPLIVPANEQGAGFMAAGYARASGKVGVAIVTSGRARPTTVTPVRDCMADSMPIVVICGQVPTGASAPTLSRRRRSAASWARPAKHVFLVTEPEKLEATVRTAFEIARTGGPARSSSIFRKTCRTGRRHSQGHGLLPMRGYRKRMIGCRKTS